MTNIDTCASFLLGMVKPLGFQPDSGTHQEVVSAIIGTMVFLTLLSVVCGDN